MPSASVNAIMSAPMDACCLARAATADTRFDRSYRRPRARPRRVGPDGQPGVLETSRSSPARSNRRTVQRRLWGEPGASPAAGAPSASLTRTSAPVYTGAEIRANAMAQAPPLSSDLCLAKSRRLPEGMGKRPPRYSFNTRHDSRASGLAGNGKRSQASQLRATKPRSQRFTLAPEEGQQVGVELIRMRVREAVRRAWIVDFRCALDELR